MRRLKLSALYRRGVKLADRQGRDLVALDKIIALLLDDAAIPAPCRDHEIVGNWKGFRELHIAPDWLLIYKKLPPDWLALVAVGTHSELFKK